MKYGARFRSLAQKEGCCSEVQLVRFLVLQCSSVLPKSCAVADGVFCPTPLTRTMAYDALSHIHGDDFIRTLF